MTQQITITYTVNKSTGGTKTLERTFGETALQDIEYDDETGGVKVRWCDGLGTQYRWVDSIELSQQ